MSWVVSTVVSGILFVRFPTVECISTIYSFFLTSLTVEARNKRESAALNAYFISNTLSSRLQHTHFSRQIFDIIKKKALNLGIHSTVGKRAKIMPDTTVETTSWWKVFDLPQFGVWWGRIYQLEFDRKHCTRLPRAFSDVFATNRNDWTFCCTWHKSVVVVGVVVEAVEIRPCPRPLLHHSLRKIKCYLKKFLKFKSFLIKLQLK